MPASIAIPQCHDEVHVMPTRDKSEVSLRPRTTFRCTLRICYVVGLGFVQRPRWGRDHNYLCAGFSARLHLGRYMMRHACAKGTIIAGLTVIGLLTSSAFAADQIPNLKGKWVISNTRSSMEPFLTCAKNRALREKGFRMWTSRGDNGDAS